MKPIARWNPARDVWEVPGTEGLLCEHLDVFSETFPNSGTWAGGMAYELPTSAPRTDGSGSSSSLLSTPQARDGKGRPGDGFNSANLVRDVQDLVRSSPLPVAPEVGATPRP